MLGRVKRWVLAMLAIERCAWLRSRRVKNAALLTRPLRRSLLNLSGRRASRQNRRLRALPRGVEQRAVLGACITSGVHI